MNQLFKTMTVSMLLNRIVGVGAFMILVLSASAQSSLMPTTSLIPVSGSQQSVTKANSDIIVDVNSATNAYPTMEQEMKMYMALKEKGAKAFFFPNPSNGVVWIEHNLGKECKVTIREKAGEIVFTANNLQAKKLDLSTFKSGEYIMELSSGSQSVSRSLSVL